MDFKLKLVRLYTSDIKISEEYFKNLIVAESNPFYVEYLPENGIPVGSMLDEMRKLFKSCIRTSAELHIFTYNPAMLEVVERLTKLLGIHLETNRICYASDSITDLTLRINPDDALMNSDQILNKIYNDFGDVIYSLSDIDDNADLYNDIVLSLTNE